MRYTYRVVQSLALSGILLILPAGRSSAGVWEFPRLFASHCNECCNEPPPGHSGQLFGELRDAMLGVLGRRREEARVARDVQRDLERAQLQRQLPAHHESLNVDLNTPLTQRFHLGQPEVDLPRLKAEIAKVEQANAELQKLHAEVQDEYRAELREQWRAYLEGHLAAATEPDCRCKAPCKKPPLPGMLPPPEQAMLPAQIPIIIRGTMEVSTGQARLENANVQRLPAKIPCAPSCDAPCPSGMPQPPCANNACPGPVPPPGGP